MPNEMSAKVTGSIEAVLTRVRADVDLDAPLFAINWFDTRSLWLYNIYNILASRSVRAVGGQVVIKGKVKDVLAGEVADRRGVLLIVCYPSGHMFLRMVQGAYFKLVSVLRLAAVSRFTFGFTQPSHEISAQSDDIRKMAYLVHFFRGVDVSGDIVRIAQELGIGVVYLGRSAARLATRKADGKKSTLPFPMDGIVVLKADREDRFRHLIDTKEFRIAAKKSERNFTATLTRLL